MTSYDQLRFESRLNTPSVRVSIYSGPTQIYGVPDTYFLCVWRRRIDLSNYHEAAFSGHDLPPGRYHVVTFTPLAFDQVRLLLRTDQEAESQLAALSGKPVPPDPSAVDALVAELCGAADGQWSACLGEGNGSCLNETPVTREEMRALGYL